MRSPQRVVLAGLFGGAISGALALGSARFLSGTLHEVDPVTILSSVFEGPAITGFAMAAVAGAIAGILLGLVTRSVARLAHKIVFACAMCPAASLCADVWLFACALPLVPMLIASGIFATCVACLLPRT